MGVRRAELQTFSHAVILLRYPHSATSMPNTLTNSRYETANEEQERLIFLLKLCGLR